MQAAPPPIIVTSVSRMVTDSSGMVATHVGLLGRDIYGSLQTADSVGLCAGLFFAR